MKEEKYVYYGVADIKNFEIPQDVEVLGKPHL